MKVEWDYTSLAQAYLKRPDYAQCAIDDMLKEANIEAGDYACDVGAGAAHLTLMLARAGLIVYAVEPNDAMRANGINKTQEYGNVTWSEGVGESTGMEDDRFNIVTFGSSFNVCDRPKALLETARILKKGGFFACMWNHRDLNDSLQSSIEEIIKSHIPDYSYGSRREDQTAVIDESGLFNEVKYIEGTVNHSILAEDFIEGWKSHGTVYRQSPNIFEAINSDIRTAVEKVGQKYIDIPYTTRIWMAQKKN